MGISQWFAANTKVLGWALLTFLLGMIAGFQLFVARYPREYAMAIRTIPALSYLIIRGSLPAILFIVLYKSQLLSLPPLGSALVLGLGSEAFLRSRFLLSFRSTGPAHLPTEASAGPLDFITWLQDFFLDRTGKVLTKWRMAKVNYWYRDCDLRFDELCATLENDLPAIGGEDEKERRDASAILASSKIEYDSMKAILVPPAIISDEMERRCRLKLGYALYYALDKNSFYALSRRVKQR